MNTIEGLLNFANGKYHVMRYADRAAWLKGRCNTIGASEAAAVLGKSPWMNEVELWERKRGKEVEEKCNANMTRGQRSEAHIRELYSIEMGYDILDGTNIILVSTENPFMSCTLDGILLEHDKDWSEIPVVFEIKSARKNDMWGNDTIPDHYLIQVLHQLAVTGWDKAILRVRFFASPGYEAAWEKSYTFLREDYEDQIEALISKERWFWEFNVKNGHKPSIKMPEI